MLDSQQMAAIRKIIIIGRELERGERERDSPRRFSKISLEKCRKDSTPSRLAELILAGNQRLWQHRNS